MSPARSSAGGKKGCSGVLAGTSPTTKHHRPTAKVDNILKPFDGLDASAKDAIMAIMAEQHTRPPAKQPPVPRPSAETSSPLKVLVLGRLSSGDFEQQEDLLHEVENTFDKSLGGTVGSAIAQWYGIPRSSIGPMEFAVVVGSAIAGVALDTSGNLEHLLWQQHLPLLQSADAIACMGANTFATDLPSWRWLLARLRPSSSLWFCW